MDVVFRADASKDIGSGHVMRCLALANNLKRNGARVDFICREHPGNMCAFIESSGYQVHRLSCSSTDSPADQTAAHSPWLGTHWAQDAEETIAVLNRRPSLVDWIIVDHYALERNWETAIRTAASHIMIIDDLADRPHECDVLLDQNLYSEMQRRYDLHTTSKCLKLLGPDYALLRQEFSDIRRKLEKRNGLVKNILVSFGGNDIHRTTMAALQIIRRSCGSEMTVDVVAGPQFEFMDELEDACSTHSQWKIHKTTNQMAQLMAKADFAFGGGGTTTWERCCLGLPCLIFAQAFNQIAISEAAHKAKVGFYVGEASQIDLEYGTARFKEILSKPNVVAEMSQRGMALVDGHGTQRTCSALRNAH